MRKFILLVSIVSISAFAFAQDPLVLLRDGTMAKPAEATPLSPEQLAKSVGNAFFARTADGQVFLVTAAHVGATLGRTFQQEGADIAPLLVWQKGAFPNAAKLPEIAGYREHVPITVRAWSLTRNVPVEYRCKAQPLTNDLRELSKRVDDARGGTVALDYWRTRSFERWNMKANTAADMLIGPGCSGGLVLQEGRAVGVISSGNLIKGREQIMFELLLPSGRKPRGLPPPPGTKGR